MKASKPVNTVLELRNLSKHFPNHRAVNGISFQIQKGEFFSLVGPSGCGKTTTLRLLAGFETPTSGEILLEGASIGRLKPHQRDITTVFQNYALFPHLTVAQNVAFGLERRHTDSASVQQRVRDALSLVHLEGKQNRMPHQISGGERQRVALARSLVVQPKLLLLDEPLSALDPQLRKQMRAELKNLQREVGITFLFITHDQEEALSLSDRMAVMNAGQLEQIGVPRDLYRKPETKFVAEFLGEINWLDGAGVRPESLRVCRERPEREVPFLAGVVQGLTFLGSRIHLRAALEGGADCMVELDEAEARFHPGDAVHVWWHPADELRLPAVSPV